MHDRKWLYEEGQRHRVPVALPRAIDEVLASEQLAVRDIWEPIVDLYLARNDVTFEWVKAHHEDRYNDLVDQLAVEASRTQLDRRGRADEL